MLTLLTVSAALVLKTPAAPKPTLDAAAIRALPGDPSLVLHTSASLGDNKVTFMKACSNAIATTLSKPESYVSVCVHDEAAVIWAGEETPCALGVVCSVRAEASTASGVRSTIMLVIPSRRRRSGQFEVGGWPKGNWFSRSEEHTSELQSP